MTKNSILIVEDDTALNEMLRFLLNRNGYKVFQAEDTAQADRCMESQLPDVVLLDWMLPAMDGIDYAKKLKSHPMTRDIAIIMVTARGEEEDKVKGLDCGADDYVTKPFSNNELLARIRSAIRRRGAGLLPLRLSPLWALAGRAAAARRPRPSARRLARCDRDASRAAGHRPLPDGALGDFLRGRACDLHRC